MKIWKKEVCRQASIEIGRAEANLTELLLGVILSETAVWISCLKQNLVVNYLKRFSGDGMINYKGKNEIGAVLTFHVNIKILEYLILKNWNSEHGKKWETKTFFKLCHSGH